MVEWWFRTVASNNTFERGGKDCRSYSKPYDTCNIQVDVGLFYSNQYGYTNSVFLRKIYNKYHT